MNTKTDLITMKKAFEWWNSLDKVDHALLDKKYLENNETWNDVTIIKMYKAEHEQPSASQLPPLTQGRMYVEVGASTPPEENGFYFTITQDGRSGNNWFREGKWIDEIMNGKPSCVKSWLKPVPHTPAPAVSDERSYQIDFGNHLRCQVKIANNKIEVVGAIDGWGNDVYLERVVIEELGTQQAAATPAPIASDGDQQ